jgi:hypothetical protein
MSKKLLIPLIILAIVCAAGLGIFIASNQSVQPTSTVPTEQKNELALTEIGKTITVPTELGKVSYAATDQTTLALYSDKYEKLNGCAGHHLAELKLSQTQNENALRVDGEYPYATFVAQPMGVCNKEDGERLAGVLLSALNDAR